MPDPTLEKRIENTIQHYLYRGGTFRDPSTEVEALPDTSLLIQQLQAAAMEQTRSDFAFSSAGSEWLRSISRLISVALEDRASHPPSSETLKAMMQAINTIEAFDGVQELLRK